jgi:hypothetical protein
LAEGGVVRTGQDSVRGQSVWRCTHEDQDSRPVRHSRARAACRPNVTCGPSAVL